MDKKIQNNTRSEILLLNQRQKIEQYKYKISVNSISSPPSHDEILQAKHTISFNDDKDNNWRYSTFETSIASYLDEAPLILNNQWSFISGNQPRSLEIRNLIFQNESQINYLLVNCSIKASILLKGESSFFLILRSFNVFSEESAVVSLNKEEFSQKIYLSLGTFVRPEYSRDNELLYKVFAKQQLIIAEGDNGQDFERLMTAFIETDSASISLKLIDNGSETITVSAKMNNSKFENTLTGNFFLPTIDKKRVMIAGSGTQCKIKDFTDECFYKEKYMIHEPNVNLNSRGCDCCNIY